MVIAALFSAAMVLLGTLLSPISVGAAAEGGQANITLHAKWEATPLVHEAAEFLVSRL